MPLLKPPLEALKKRAQFQSVSRAGVRVNTDFFTLQAHRPPPAEAGDALARIHIGFTVTRKVGTAVERNRIRRRLRTCVARVLADETANPGLRGLSCVIVARRTVLAGQTQALDAALAYAAGRAVRLLERRRMENARSMQPEA